jgi:hypothetical protein
LEHLRQRWLVESTLVLQNQIHNPQRLDLPHELHPSIHPQQHRQHDPRTVAFHSSSPVSKPLLLFPLFPSARHPPQGHLPRPDPHRRHRPRLPRHLPHARVGHAEPAGGSSSCSRPASRSTGWGNAGERESGSWTGRSWTGAETRRARDRSTASWATSAGHAETSRHVHG